MFTPQINQHVVCQVEGRPLYCRVVAVSPINSRAKVVVTTGPLARLERWVSVPASKMRKVQ